MKKTIDTAKPAKGQKLVTAAVIKKNKVLASAPAKAKPTAGKPVYAGKTDKTAKPAAAAKPGDKPAAKAS